MVITEGKRAEWLKAEKVSNSGFLNDTADHALFN